MELPVVVIRRAGNPAAAVEGQRQLAGRRAGILARWTESSNLSQAVPDKAGDFSTHKDARRGVGLSNKTAPPRGHE